MDSVINNPPSGNNQREGVQQNKKKVLFSRTKSRSDFSTSGTYRHRSAVLVQHEEYDRRSIRLPVGKASLPVHTEKRPT